MSVSAPYFSVNRSGYTRIVFLLGNHAIKVPKIGKIYTRKGAGAFLRGLKSNKQEALIAGLGWEELCPVSFYLWGGFFLVMERAEPLPHALWVNFDYVNFVYRGGRMKPEAREEAEEAAKQPFDATRNLVPVEYKKDSFGVLNGRIVAVDYGGYR